MMNVGPNGQSFIAQIHNGERLGNPDALIEYKCFVCGESGTSFGMPTHFRQKELEFDSRDLLMSTRDGYLPAPEYECAAREIERCSRFRFETEPRRELASDR